MNLADYAQFEREPVSKRTRAAIHDDARVTALSVAMVALGGGPGKLGVRQTNEVACQTRVEHLSRHRDTTLRRLVFYGYALPEYLAMIEVVGAHFPLKPGSVPGDEQEYFKRL